jgi:hypothetical protein
VSVVERDFIHTKEMAIQVLKNSMRKTTQFSTTKQPDTRLY